MKKLLVSLVVMASLSTTLSTTVNAAGINGRWNDQALKVRISGNNATVNGMHVKLKVTGNNRWRSVAIQSSQPFTLSKHGNQLIFKSGLDRETLHK